MNWTILKTLKVKRFTVICPSLNNPLKDRILYYKREKFCSLWLILQNYQRMSYPSRLIKLFKSHPSLLHLFGLFISMLNSCRHLSLPWRCLLFLQQIAILSLYVAYNMSLCSIWETLWRDHEITGNSATKMEPHVFNSILPLSKDEYCHPLGKL
jgi:hypothetical protein